MELLTICYPGNVKFDVFVNKIDKDDNPIDTRSKLALLIFSNFNQSNNFFKKRVDTFEIKLTDYAKSQGIILSEDEKLLNWENFIEIFNVTRKTIGRCMFNIELAKEPGCLLHAYLRK